MEARIARLESDVGHLRTDVAEIKVDVRALRDKIDGVNNNLGDRLDSFESSAVGKLDELSADIHRFKMWGLILYFPLAAMVFANMALAFGWL